MNLKYGVRGPETRTGTETDTCTACAGTIILEFAALSRFTGDPVFEVGPTLGNLAAYLRLIQVAVWLSCCNAEFQHRGGETTQ